MAQPDGIVTKPSPRPVAETLRRLTELVEGKGLKVFALVDHSGEAAAAGLQMPDTKLLIFGSPAAGTPMMLAAPLVALDLPLKVLVWEDAGGQTQVSYNSPAYMAARYELSDDLTARIAAIDGLTEVVVAP